MNDHHEVKRSANACETHKWIPSCWNGAIYIYQHSRIWVGEHPSNTGLVIYGMFGYRVLTRSHIIQAINYTNSNMISSVLCIVTNFISATMGTIGNQL